MIEFNKESRKSKREGDICWRRHYAALLQYKEQHGHCNVPSNATYECILHEMNEVSINDYEYRGNLGKWLTSQRRAKKGRKGAATLTQEEDALLQVLSDQGSVVYI